MSLRLYLRSAWVSSLLLAMACGGAAFTGDFSAENDGGGGAPSAATGGDPNGATGGATSSAGTVGGSTGGGSTGGASTGGASTGGGSTNAGTSGGGTGGNTGTGLTDSGPDGTISVGIDGGPPGNEGGAPGDDGGPPEPPEAGGPDGGGVGPRDGGDGGDASDDRDASNVSDGGDGGGFQDGGATKCHDLSQRLAALPVTRQYISGKSSYPSQGPFGRLKAGTYVLVEDALLVPPEATDGGAPENRGGVFSETLRVTGGNGLYLLQSTRRDWSYLGPPVGADAGVDLNVRTTHLLTSVAAVPPGSAHSWTRTCPTPITSEGTVQYMLSTGGGQFVTFFFTGTPYIDAADPPGSVRELTYRQAP